MKQSKKKSIWTIPVLLFWRACSTFCAMTPSAPILWSPNSTTVSPLIPSWFFVTRTVQYAFFSRASKGPPYASAENRVSTHNQRLLCWMCNYLKESLNCDGSLAPAPLPFSIKSVIALICRSTTLSFWLLGVNFLFLCYSSSYPTSIAAYCSAQLLWPAWLRRPQLQAPSSPCATDWWLP